MKYLNLIKIIFIFSLITNNNLKKQELEQKFLNFNNLYVMSDVSKPEFCLTEFKKSYFLDGLIEEIHNWNRLYENIRTYEFEYPTNNYFKAQIDPFDIKIKIKLKL